MDEVTLRKNYLSTAIQALEKAIALNVTKGDEDASYKSMIFLLKDMMKQFYSGNQPEGVK